MPLDLSKVPPLAKARYLRVGRSYSSTDTLAQGHATLKAYGTDGAVLEAHGFCATDAALLADACAALVSAGVGRSAQAVSQQATTKDYGLAFEEAVAVREQARSVLSQTQAALEYAGEEGTAIQIAAALRETRVLPKKPEPLAIQLDTLRSTLGDDKVAPAAKVRGGPAASKELEETAAALRASAKEHDGNGKGTVLSTEQMDITDGIIVKLTRGAYQAARAAARKLGQPAIAKAFALTHLTPVRKEKPKAEAAPKAEKAKAKAKPEPEPAPEAKPEPTAG
jgi:hypothetical protein